MDDETVPPISPKVKINGEGAEIEDREYREDREDNEDSRYFGRGRDREHGPGQPFLLQPCRNTAAFEMRPRRKGARLDLERAREILLGLGFRMVADARVLLILERECAINLWPSGRILIRTLDEALARRLAETLVSNLF